MPTTCNFLMRKVLRLASSTFITHPRRSGNRGLILSIRLLNSRVREYGRDALRKHAWLRAAVQITAISATGVAGIIEAVWGGQSDDGAITARTAQAILLGYSVLAGIALLYVDSQNANTRRTGADTCNSPCDLYVERTERDRCLNGQRRILEKSSA